MAKAIVDAILGLSLDDSPSNLAAATLLYILTGDVSLLGSICEFIIVVNYERSFESTYEL